MKSTKEMLGSHSPSEAVQDYVPDETVVDNVDVHNKALEPKEVKYEQDIIEYELEKKKKMKSFKIIDKPTYKKMVSGIRMMTQERKNLHLLIINSKPGIGKSFTTEVIMNQYDADYIILNNHITKLELFIIMQKNKDKIIIIDDVKQMLKSSPHVGLIKKATETVPYGREVQYNTSKKIKDEDGEELEKSFVFNGKIIILTNEVDEDDKDVKAIKDRALYLRLAPPNEEIVEIMEWVVSNPLPESTDLDLKQRTEVKEFIKNNMMDRANLSLRTLVLGYEFYADSLKNNDIDSWKTNLMESDEELDSCIIAGKINDNPNFKTKEERADEYAKLTRKAVATYYRDLKKYIDIYKKV